MKCPNCDDGRDFENIGNHWRQGCEYPFPDSDQEKALDGMVMGDACISRSSAKGNPSIDLIGTNKTFLAWVLEEFHPLFVTLEVDKTPEEAAREGSPVEMKSLPKTVYRLRSRRLPFFGRYEGWYSADGKRFPEGVEIDPQRVRYWYVGDGGLCWNKDTKSPRAQICSSNESDRLDEFANVFGEIGHRPTVYDDRVMFDRVGTEWFLDWMGDPLPGFGYKWEDGSLESYERKMENAYQ